MNFKKTTLVIISLFVLSAFVFVGCGQTASNSGSDKTDASSSIIALGSTAMQPLVDEAAKQYMAGHSNAQIQVQGGGSGQGLSQVSSGSANIGNSDVFAEEKKGVDAKALVDHRICVVGMGTVVNKDAGITNLTKQQLIDIFTGKVTNWKAVGGKDLKITLVNRSKSSGTRAVFKKLALDGKDEAQGITEDSSGTVKKIITQTPGAIGYLAFSYFDNSIQVVSLDGVAPTVDNVITGKYPVWAYEHSYTKGEATGLAKDFINYMMSPDVQNSIVPKLGYIPEGKMKVTRDADGTVKNK